MECITHQNLLTEILTHLSFRLSFNISLMNLLITLLGKMMDSFCIFFLKEKIPSS